MNTSFRFLDPGELVDGELSLVLVKKDPGVPERGRVPEYVFEMRRSSTPVKIGQLRLRIGQLPFYISHIVYSVSPEHRGHHFASRACRLVVGLANRHGMDELSITCLPENASSKRTCELAGAVYIGIIDVPDEGVDDYHKTIDKKCKYILRTDLEPNKAVEATPDGAPHL